MTINFALQYIPRRMKELGYGDNYYMYPKNLVIPRLGRLKIPAHDQYYILVEELTGVSISSDNGFFDLGNTNTNEQIYEHRGQIIITNRRANPLRIKFIQLIPYTIHNTPDNGRADN